MCGIAGAIALSSDAVRDVVHRMTVALTHRGPDDSGTVLFPIASHGYLGMGHRRLAILDLSPAGHQPMQDADTGNSITYNGEIYNFRSLREELEAKGYRFQSQTDTEVILKSYDAFGHRCLDKLRGMFAFAIWDTQKQRLFLARDRLGIKPLYYYHKDGQFLFASELRALVASGLVPREFSVDGLLTYLSLGAVQQPLTLVDEAFCLLPGHYLEWRDGQVKTIRYWDALPSIETQTAKSQHVHEANLEAIRAHLEESVRLRLISDVPLGAFLSGGIDSSAVVALMSTVSQTPVKTFSIGFKENTFDESVHARVIAQRFQTDHVEIVISSQDVLVKLDSILNAMDQPTIDGVNTYVISQAVKHAGITVALSGLGGDELFAGYPSFVDVPRAERFVQFWNAFPPSLRRLAAFTWGKVVPISDRTDKLKMLLAGDIQEEHPYFLSRALFTKPKQDSLLHADVPREMTQATFLAHQEHILSEVSRLDPINRVSYLELTGYMSDMLLRDIDAMSMAHALEVRVPLIDHRLVELMLRTPGSLKISGDTPKRLLVHALKDLLPDSIVYRRKQGFTFPFAEWMQHELRSEMESMLLSEAGPLDRVLSSRGVREVWQDFLAGRTSWSRPWGLYVLKWWMQHTWAKI
ncbi:asparagine synthase (glutamine-hydrolyzing) [Candidatus Poribacteria bacterium]|nr:asparagine synthase (glutamine-hydrolyzing) [Candidatus Poribacteria bacterium]